jgi:hypothetical protein
MKVANIELGELIKRARDALGGQQQLTNIVTFRSEMIRRMAQADGTVETIGVKVYRAAGGRIRSEEMPLKGQQVIRVVNGWAGRKIIRNLATGTETVSDLSPDEIAWLRREAKIFPRNFLAHADEYDIRYLGTRQEEGVSGYCVEFLEEKTIYCFDPMSYLCRMMTDHVTESVWTFDDFAPVDGIVTVRKIIMRQKDGVTIQDQLMLVRYNEPLHDGLFEV